MSPIAARLSLDCLRRDVAIAPAWHHALIQVLRHSQVSGELLSVQPVLKFEEGLLAGMPITASGPAREALRFIFACRNVEDGRQTLRQMS